MLLATSCSAVLHICCHHSAWFKPVWLFVSRPRMGPCMLMSCRRHHAVVLRAGALLAVMAPHYIGHIVQRVDAGSDVVVHSTLVVCCSWSFCVCLVEACYTLLLYSCTFVPKGSVHAVVKLGFTWNACALSSVPCSACVPKW
ncbi:hypothetical protein COO60DRAFT_1492630 [Scenedesmus sp. NREL 46B-D3]|nr:hypothetical protein COO60DRAFT_1492630 [Scenedesmus sp. NREL 46B-D3]